MQNFSVIGHESSGSQVVNLVIDVRLMGVFSTVNVLAELCGSAFSDVGSVGVVLSVNEEELIIHVLELFFSQKCVLEH